MSTGVALAGLLLLLALAAAVAWQERRRPAGRAIVYGVEDSIEFILAGLDTPAAARLRERDVRRILEWAVRFLQDPALRVEADRPPVAAGLEAAAYVQEQALAAGYAYDGDLIIEVLELQAEYLASLGAVGDPVEEDPGREADQ